MYLKNELTMAGEHITAITGGIGAGKSLVSRILRVMGFEVYDCDSGARRLMDDSDEIKQRLVALFGPEVVSNGVIDRPRLASIVFSDSEKLSQLNALVHGEVRDDIRRWCFGRKGRVFVETAILYQSGLDRLVDEVWEVTAPREVRAMRAARRDNSSADEIIRRIESQDSFCPEQLHANIREIVNDGFRPLLPQILQLLKVLS